MVEGAITLPRTGRPSRLRAFRTYLLAILACTLLLFSSNLVSMVQKQYTVKENSRTNIAFAGERIAFEFEGRLQRLAADCLRPERLKALPPGPWNEGTPQRARAARKVFEGWRNTHPLAEHFFVVSAGRVVFPMVSTTTGRTTESIASAEHSSAASQFLRLFKGGEREEGQRPERALELFHAAGTLPVSDRLKALALSRAARTLVALDRPADATEEFGRLLRSYGDQYDEAQIPHTLALALSPGRLASRLFTPYPQALLGVYQDLSAGRWELSAEQTDRSLAALEERLAMTESSRPSSMFLNHAALGRALAAEIRVRPMQPAGEVSPRAFMQNRRAYQAFYTSLPGAGAEAAFVGFSVSVPWVKENLLPQSLQGVLRQDQSLSVFIQEVASSDPGTDQGDDVMVPFKTVLPYWRIHIPASGMQVTAAVANRELLFLGLSSGMFLSVFGLVGYLLIRVSRDMQWYDLRSGFVSGVSHELKTPLSLIRLYSETLADGGESFPAEERRSYIRIIARESERLSRLIDNILDFSNIEQGRKRYTMQEGDLALTVRQTVEDYSEYLALRGFVVRTGIQPDLPPVLFNREQVSQVVLNLLDNARKYSGNSRLIRVHMWRQGNEVVVEVQDHGLGIPASERGNIFEPFYRLPRAEEEGGCGLGLFLVRHVVEGHGGRIELESELDKGSRFRLFFPVGGASPKRIKPPREYEAARART